MKTLITKLIAKFQAWRVLREYRKVPASMRIQFAMNGYRWMKAESTIKRLAFERDTPIGKDRFTLE